MLVIKVQRSATVRGGNAAAAYGLYKNVEFISKSMAIQSLEKYLSDFQINDRR
jgi:hypothetical protein